MNILSIETSTQRGGVAIQFDDQQAEYVIDTPRAHREQIIGQVSCALADAGLELSDLDAIAFGRGPGSFIGVRLASAVAQGLATAAGIGLAPVSSMAALARHAALTAGAPAPEPLHIVVCLDARMGEVYVAEYDWRDAAVIPRSAESLTQPEAVALPEGNGWLAVGNGFVAYPALRERAEVSARSLAAVLEPRAIDLLSPAAAAVRADRLVAADAWRSEYLRDESAWQRLE